MNLRLRLHATFFFTLSSCLSVEGQNRRKFHLAVSKTFIKYKISNLLLYVGELKIYAWQKTSLYYHTQTTIITLNI